MLRYLIFLYQKEEKKPLKPAEAVLEKEVKIVLYINGSLL